MTDAPSPSPTHSRHEAAAAEWLYNHARRHDHVGRVVDVWWTDADRASLAAKLEEIERAAAEKEEKP